MRSFVAMFLQRFPITCTLRTVQGTGTRNSAQLWPGASNIAIRRDRFEHRANRTAVFQSGTRLDLKHLAVAQNCVNGQHSIRSTWFCSGNNNQRVCVFLKSYSLAEKSLLRPKRVLFVMILRRKIGDQSFPSFCSSLRRKNFFNTFSKPHF